MDVRQLLRDHIRRKQQVAAQAGPWVAGMDDHEEREPPMARNHEQQAGPVEPRAEAGPLEGPEGWQAGPAEPGAEARPLEGPEGRQAGPVRRQGRLRGPYRNLKPY